MSDKQFVNGMIFKIPTNAPEWVKGTLSVKAEDFYQFMKQHVNNGWLNIDLKVSKSGKAYAELNTYGQQNQQPKFNNQNQQQQGFNQQPNIQFNDESVFGEPF